MDKNTKMNELKRRARRNGLLNELKAIGDFELSSFMSPTENDLFCKAAFRHLSLLENKKKVGNCDYQTNVELTKEYLLDYLKVKSSQESCWFLLFFRESEIEAVSIQLDNLHVNLERYIEITQYKSGRADFILLTNDLKNGICIERQEHYYELSAW